MKMISFEAAHKIIMDSARSFGQETIPLSRGIGRVLNEDWYTDRDLPPYDRVTMDGIAINYAGALGRDKLKVEGIVAAGDPQATLDDPGTCFEIMTGAVCPNGADTIVRYEDLSIEDGYATIHIDLQKNKNIHWKGEDIKKNKLVVASGTQLSPAEIGIGASIGKSEIVVYRQPRTIIISTGDELVEIDETPAPHQIRRGNVYRMQATLNHLGLRVDTDHLHDQKEEIVLKLQQYLDVYDLIILSGGVSKGKYDYLPAALKECGVRQHFHRVAQRPGKPLWFGTRDQGATVFALPGNPVSSFMCLQVYVLDWLSRCSGNRDNQHPVARLNGDILFKPDLTYFHEVQLNYSEEGEILATPQKGRGSGDLTNLTKADAFIRLPRGKDHFRKGEYYPLYIYR
ncbi:MAG: molybdopterin molybdotransferase MoeA [Bacteroidia bacterium]|nr:molybdopterin molybdotransferase MoeA [Bacteroidia bacterium]